MPKKSGKVMTNKTRKHNYSEKMGSDSKKTSVRDKNRKAAGVPKKMNKRSKK